MSKDAMREEFDSWMKRRHPGIDWIIDRADDNPEAYRNPGVQSHWESWQASREALVIELPDSVANTGTPTSNAVLEYKRECRAAIEATGARVK